MLSLWRNMKVFEFPKTSSDSYLYLLQGFKFHFIIEAEWVAQLKNSHTIGKHKHAIRITILYASNECYDLTILHIELIR